MDTPEATRITLDIAVDYSQQLNSSAASPQDEPEPEAALLQESKISHESAQYDQERLLDNKEPEEGSRLDLSIRTASPAAGEKSKSPKTPKRDREAKEPKEITLIGFSAEFISKIYEILIPSQQALEKEMHELIKALLKIISLENKKTSLGEMKGIVKEAFLDKFASHFNIKTASKATLTREKSKQLLNSAFISLSLELFNTAALSALLKRRLFEVAQKLAKPFSDNEDPLPGNKTEFELGMGFLTKKFEDGAEMALLVEGAQRELELVLGELLEIENGEPFVKINQLFKQTLFTYAVKEAATYYRDNDIAAPLSEAAQQHFMRKARYVYDAFDTLQDALRLAQKAKQVRIMTSFDIEAAEKSVEAREETQLHPIAKAYFTLEFLNEEPRTPIEIYRLQIVDFLKNVQQKLPLYFQNLLSEGNAVKELKMAEQPGSPAGTFTIHEELGILKGPSGPFAPSLRDMYTALRSESNDVVLDPVTLKPVDPKMVRYQVLVADLEKELLQVTTCCPSSKETEARAALAYYTPPLRTLLSLSFVYSSKQMALMFPEEYPNNLQRLVYAEFVVVSASFGLAIYALTNPKKPLSVLTRILESFLDSSTILLYALGTGVAIFIVRNPQYNDPHVRLPTDEFMHTIAPGPLTIALFWFFWNSITPERKDKLFKKHFSRRGIDGLGRFMVYNGILQLFSIDFIKWIGFTLSNKLYKLLFQIGPAPIAMLATYFRSSPTVGNKVHAATLYVLGIDNSVKLVQDLFPFLETSDCRFLPEEQNLARQILHSVLIPAGFVTTALLARRFLTYYRPEIVTRAVILRDVEGRNEDTAGLLSPEQHATVQRALESPPGGMVERGEKTAEAELMVLQSMHATKHKAAYQRQLKTPLLPDAAQNTSEHYNPDAQTIKSKNSWCPTSCVIL